MINLLPPEEKRQLHAARANTLLIRYNVVLVVAAGILALGVAVTYVYLNATKANAQQTINDNNAKVRSYADVQTQANQFRSNLSIAKQILDHDVTYTKIIIEIANLLPHGVTLENLNLDAQTFGTETVLIAKAKDYASALALKASFEKSSLFTNVHFQSISSGDANTPYPFSVDLAVTIKKDAAQ